MRKIIIIITIIALIASFVVIGVVAYMDTVAQNTEIENTSPSGISQ